MRPRQHLVEAGLLRWIGAGSQPMETSEGWLMVYHSGMWISEDHGQKLYLLWLALLDRDDPSKLLAQSRDPIYWPLLGENPREEDWYRRLLHVRRPDPRVGAVGLHDPQRQPYHLGKMPMETVWRLLDRTVSSDEAAGKPHGGEAVASPARYRPRW